MSHTKIELQIHQPIKTKPIVILTEPPQISIPLRIHPNTQLYPTPPPLYLSSPSQHTTQYTPTMASLFTSRALLRSAPRTFSAATPAIRALSTTPVRPDASASTTDRFSNIPDFSKYRSKKSGGSNLVYQYFMVGAMGALTAAGAKATVQGLSFFPLDMG